MSEPQYQSYHDFPKEQLGSMASQYWRDDPKLFYIHGARYKHTAKLLSGKKFVAEIGCGCGTFSNTVKKEVGKLNLFDFDKKFIDEIYEMGGEDAYCHDILHSKLEYGPYDAIYSLDVFEHINYPVEHIYLENIYDSLKKDGVFICGIPSLESQKYASKASKIGHVNCKSGTDFKALLEKYYKNVFLFSMNDETLHTGFYPMAHYLLSVCCSKK